MVENHSEFFWLKVKRFSEFDFTAKFWVFRLKKQFRIEGGVKKASRHFFAKKWRNEAARLLFTRRQPLFTQNRRFSSLPRRNAMKPGHLHRTPEKTYLWRRFIPLTLHFTCEEVGLRSTCLSRRNLRSRWRRMKFSPFLLRQGYGGQAASKDGVTFIQRFAYTAALPPWFFLFAEIYYFTEGDHLMAESKLRTLAIDFAVQILNLVKFLIWRSQ